MMSSRFVKSLQLLVQKVAVGVENTLTVEFGLIPDSRRNSEIPGHVQESFYSGWNMSSKKLAGLAGLASSCSPFVYIFFFFSIIFFFPPFCLLCITTHTKCMCEIQQQASSLASQTENWTSYRNYPWSVH